MRSEKVRFLAARLLKTGTSKVWIGPEALKRVKEALTSDDVKALVKEGLIKARQAEGHSKAGARLLKEKKSKGRKKGYGKRKGTWKARMKTKEAWMKNVRSQRRKLNEFKEKKLVDRQLYRKMYGMVKGNYFRGQKHMEEFIKKEAE